MNNESANLLRPSARILAVGNELLNGAIADRNTSSICRFLEERGIDTERGVTVRDVDGEILSELKAAVEAADIVFTTGGLGPTSDDRTRYVIADAFDAPLAESASARAKLEGLFAARKRPMSENNLRQVLFPLGATILENTEGTADSFVTFAKRQDGRVIPVISLPGIPRELHHLLKEKVSAWVREWFPAAKSVTRLYLRSFGRSESYLGEKIEALNLPATLEIAYRPMFPEILLTFTDTTGELTPTELEAILQRVREAAGNEFIFSSLVQENMAATVFEMLFAKKLTLAAAESCSGGMIADAFVSLPGASSVFLGSIVSYHNRLKENLLGVPHESISKHGAVSPEVAKEMALGARLLSEADFGISVTGIAGPDGGSREKPVGTVFFGLSTKDGEHAIPQFYAIERNMFRSFCTTAALDIVRRKLLNLPLEWQRR